MDDGKMIGKVSFIITGIIILSIHGLCKISYAKCGTIRGQQWERKHGGQKGKKVRALPCKRSLFDAWKKKKIRGFTIGWKTKMNRIAGYEDFTTFIWRIVRFCDAITYSLFWWKGR